MKRNLILSFFILLAFSSNIKAINDEARLLRFPAVSKDKIVFTYAGDLYTVPIEGGQANRITSHVGFECFPKFAPDGKTIAFTGQYDGNTEVYTIPAEGGAPRRITYTATVDRDNIGDRMGPNNIVMGWTPDGQNIIFRTKWYAFSGLRGQLMLTPASGGNLSEIPCSEGGFCSYSPNGKKLAMNRMFREFRTWKYYRGGQADDIWINTVGTTRLENITNNDAQDVFPMWIDNDIYFLSDRDSIMNLFCYNTVNKATTKITNFEKYDCKFPSYSQDNIVFENGGYIYRYQIKNKELIKVPITLNAEGLYARSRFSDKISGDYALSPDGSRVLFNVRGDILSTPATIGATYNLTNTPGSHEREAVWSPDGQNIAYLSDADGEYQIYLLSTLNPSSPRILTNFKDGYPSQLKWSPNSDKLYCCTEKKELLAIDVPSGKTTTIFQGEFGGIRSYTISKDGNWIAYTTLSKNQIVVIGIYDTRTHLHHIVTSEWYNSSNPIFSDDGNFMYFTSLRDFNANYSQIEWNAAYRINSYVFALPLNNDVVNPLLIIGEEYTNKNPVEKKESKSTPSIDFSNIVERAFALPLNPGNYNLISASSSNVYYYNAGEIKRFDLKTQKEATVGQGYILTFSPNGEKVLINRGNNYYVCSFPALVGDTPINTTNLKVKIDYPQEWQQIFDETWRIYRDYFYVKNMRGKDWKQIHDKYAELLPYVKHRQDLTYIIGEMISELNVGHAYVTTGEAPTVERIKTGLLGAKIKKDPSGYFIINKIFKGENWNPAQRSPLAAQGLKVKEGDYIIAVDGKPAKEMQTIYESLIGKVGTVVALQINTSPTDKGSRTIYIKPIADESKLAYYEWVHNNIDKVTKASNGQIGYIHIPDMSVAGLDEFTKLFYSQLDKKALIIDDRMNGGGNVSPMILERLQREVYRLTMARNGNIIPGTVPAQTQNGPKVCLVDKYSSSDGDLFPYGFQRLKLGPIIGMRTWGGIVGISGSKNYLDGQDVRTPFFTSYSLEGNWIIENHGVDPDIIVDINPFEDYKGNDAQLNKAIDYLLDKIDKDYKSPAPIPSDPIV